MTRSDSVTTGCVTERQIHRLAERAENNRTLRTVFVTTVWLRDTILHNYGEGQVVVVLVRGLVVSGELDYFTEAVERTTVWGSGNRWVGLEGKGGVGLSVGCSREGGFSTVNSSALASPRLGVLDEPLQGDVWGWGEEHRGCRTWSEGFPFKTCCLSMKLYPWSSSPFGFCPPTHNTRQIYKLNKPSQLVFFFIISLFL